MFRGGPQAAIALVREGAVGRTARSELEFAFELPFKDMTTWGVTVLARRCGRRHGGIDQVLTNFSNSTPAQETPSTETARIVSAAAASPTLARVTQGDLCAGCGLCSAISPAGAISMIVSSDGFLRPRQAAEIPAEVENLIASTCPALRVTRSANDIEVHPLWGPIVSVHRGYASDASLRHHASSGGALSAVLVHLLESGTVDFVVQTVASADSPLANAIAESVGREDVFRAAGSRYAPSAPLGSLRMHLQRPGRFAFVGKPCDIAALQQLRRHDPRIADRVPVLVSFFCAGVPSLHGGREILRKLEAHEADVVSFRYRGDGWPGYSTATLRDGTDLRMSYAESWGGILSRHVQLRCKICPDGTGGLADIVCADAWHCDERGYPLFDEQDGYSLIVTRTAKGEALLRHAIAAGRILAEPVSVESIEAMQPGQVKRKRLVLSRLAAMAVLLRPMPRFTGWRLLKAASGASLPQNLRSFVGMARRLLARRVAADKPTHRS